MTIYFDCPQTPEPIGGIKQIYRQVDVLNRHGVPAAVVHATDGFRHRWFDNDTRIVHPSGLAPGAEDLLVVPECRPDDEVPLSHAYAWMPRVVFNQNCYLTFKDADLCQGLRDGYRSIYEDPNTLAVITVSADSADVLRKMFPRLQVMTVRCGIDTGVFRFGAHKERMISYTVRKNKLLREVLHGLRVRGSLDGYTVQPIDNRAEREVAGIMRRSLVFLTALNYEGFGLPPAEAMASGCVVIGFDGRGGREYFTGETGFPVPVGDLVGFIEAAEAVLAAGRTDVASLDPLRHRAAAFISSEYSLAREAESIVAAWRAVLTGKRVRTMA